jgi:hypothetical protein
MINALLDAFRLAKLQRARAQVSKDRDAEQKELVARGMSEEEASTQAGQMHKGDFRATHSAISVFLSDRMVKEAERLEVPVPEDDKYWIRLKYADHLHLSEEGLAILRQRVREEKKARREVISFWFNLITVILSLLVALFALYK